MTTPGSSPDRAPNILFNIGIGDETIPNTTSLVLARALGLATVQPLLLDPGMGDIVEAPLAGNLADGQRTAGFFQIDRVTFETGGVPEAAAHNYTTFSFEGQVQAGRFVETWLGGGAPEIVDPFSVLGTPALTR